MLAGDDDRSGLSPMRWGLLSAALLRGAGASSSLAVAATRLWVRLFVRDLGLCPFAGWVSDEDGSLRLAVTAVRGRPSAPQVAEEVVREARLLLGETGPRSTLVLYPALTCFDRYLEAAQTAEQALEDCGLSAHIQLATFHPRYRFRDERPGSATHWTNRSPYPMIHLLRVDDVSRAIEGFRRTGDPDEIWRRNQRTMVAMGSLRLREMRRLLMRRAGEESGGEVQPDTRESGQTPDSDCQGRGSERDNVS